MHKYTLKSELVLEKVRIKGFKSLADVATHIGLHRNTLSNFIKGAPVFPKSLTQLFSFLEIDGRRFISLLNGRDSEHTVAPIVDALAAHSSRCCIVLFGSRARGTQRAFSDFDLGIFAVNAIEHSHYLDMVELVDSMSEDFPYKVQLVNLNNDDRHFMNEIRHDIKFLGGSMSAWIKLQGAVDERSEVTQSA